MSARRSLRAVCALLAAGLALSGCVYFNTFYNAKKYYGEGEKLVREVPEDAPLSVQARTAFERSVEKSSSVLAAHPESKYADDALLLLGKAHYRLGNYSEATAALRALLEQHPQSGLKREAAMWLVRAGREAGDVAAAEELADRLLAEGRLSAEERADLELERARLAIESGDAGRAVSIYEELEADDEDVARRRGVPLLLVQARLARGDTARAVDELRPLVASGVDPAAQRKAAVVMAEVLAASGESDRAIRTYEAILAGGVADTLAAQIHLALADSRRRAGDARGAAEDLATVARLVPSTETAAHALYGRGMLEWRGLRDRDAAKKTFLEAFLQDPDSPVADSAAVAARTIQEIQHYQAILSGAERVLSPLPSEEVQATATYLLAELLYTREEDPEAARVLFAGMLQRYPRSAWTPKVLYTLGWLADERGREAPDSAAAAGSPPPVSVEAEAFYRRVIDEYPATEYARYAGERLAEAGAAGLPAWPLAGAPSPATAEPIAAAPAVAPDTAHTGGLLPLPDPAQVIQVPSGATAPGTGETIEAPAAVVADTLPLGVAGLPQPAAVAGAEPAPPGTPESASPAGATAVPGAAVATAPGTPADPVDEKLLAFSRAIPRPPDPLVGIQDRLLARRREALDDRPVPLAERREALQRGAASPAAGDSLTEEQIRRIAEPGETGPSPADTAPGQPPGGPESPGGPGGSPADSLRGRQ